MSGAKVWPGLVSRATIPKRSAEAACWRRFTTKSSSTRSEMTSLSSRHVPSVKTRLLGGTQAQRLPQRQREESGETKTKRHLPRLPPGVGLQSHQHHPCEASSCVSMITTPADGSSSAWLKASDSHQVVSHTCSRRGTDTSADLTHGVT